MKKILIVSVPVRNGHIRAADAIKKAAELYYKDVIVEHVDFATLIGRASSKFFFDSYNVLTKQFPSAYRFFYNILDNAPGAYIFDKLIYIDRKLNSKPFKSYIDKFKPDYIIFTHFTPADLYNTFHYSIPSATVVTDYVMHRLWFSGKKQKYFVAHNNIKKQLESLGVKEKDIMVSGIPVDPIFYEINRDKKELKKIIALLPSGNGKVDSIKLVQRIISNDNLKVLVFSGGDKDLEKSMRALNISSDRLELVGWTNNIHKYLRNVDVVVTKPGGLIVSECMVLKKPMIFINPIPGQEEINADYITGLGLAWNLESVDLWEEALEKIKNIEYSENESVMSGKLILDKILGE